MNEIFINPDLVLLSLVSSILFVVGVIRSYYLSEDYNRLEFNSAFFVIVMFVIRSIGFVFNIHLSFFTQSDTLLFLNGTFLFLGFSLLALNSVITKLTNISFVFIMLILGILLFPFLYFLVKESVFSEIHVLDQGKFSFLFLVSGSIVWFFEVFFKGEEAIQEHENKHSSIFLLGLPLALLTTFSNLNTESIYLNLPKFIIIFASFLIGIGLVPRKSNNSRKVSLLAILSSTTFYGLTMTESIWIHLPISIVIGIFVPLVWDWLANKNWSDSAIELFIPNCLIASLAVFSPFLLVKSQDWFHSPLVMLGVQTLFLLSVFLLSALVASLVYLFPKKRKN
ncbi:MAG: hypothetical protein SH817_01470 [Leptospira sp.]|nr:hypothetical protein [Leptospira sp.]